MAHYAKVANGIVEQALVAEAGFFDTTITDNPTLVDNAITAGRWIQTSYNTRGGVHYSSNYDEDTKSYPTDGGTPLRKNFAGVGDTYDSVKDAFYAPQPYPSWTLDETTCLWESPVAKPDDGKRYEWDEATTNWKEI